jgi:hypothetical protein
VFNPAVLQGSRSTQSATDRRAPSEDRHVGVGLGYPLRRYIHLLDDGIGEADFLDSITAEGGKGPAS